MQEKKIIKIAMRKDDDFYIVICSDKNTYEQVQKALAKWAADKTLNLTWFDAWLICLRFKEATRNVL